MTPPPPDPAPGPAPVLHGAPEAAHGLASAGEVDASVLLTGHGLPDHWRGRRRFVALLAGFGAGDAFLALRAAWRDDAARSDRLVVIAIDPRPPEAETLRRSRSATAWPASAAELATAWPPLTPGLHRLAFDDGRVELLLGIGPERDLLPQVVADIDAFLLQDPADGDGAAPRDEHLYRTLGRLAAPGATATAPQDVPSVRAGLRKAGFDVAPPDDRRAGLAARFASRAPVRRPAFRTRSPAIRSVVVVGAGVAGAFAARALAQEGCEVLVLDRADTPAAGASGNPAGLFHGVLHPDDGPHARALRAAALSAQATYARAVHDGVPGHVAGLLRLRDGDDADGAADGVDLSRWPAGWVRHASPDEVRAAGGPASAAWRFPGGGWIAPAALTRWALATPGVRFQAARPRPPCAARTCPTAAARGACSTLAVARSHGRTRWWWRVACRRARCCSGPAAGRCRSARTCRRSGRCAASWGCSRATRRACARRRCRSPAAATR